MFSSRGAMCNRQHSQACLNTSLSIRQEIQRFESVHPSIYALYDLVELVPDPLLAQQIRDHVVAIEGNISLRLRCGRRFIQGNQKRYLK
ncbi:centaurin-gamma-1A-like [Leguminivora glycinivorella]|uniref:centaurin-gamma-1A-like n=1 Tax=Leguminivora glycinivorella TaxID=1035111 RepID=UPI0020103B93|nr:centaurin-gamma-1A-like [Leguminivora glycinivorella]